MLKKESAVINAYYTISVIFTPFERTGTTPEVLSIPYPKKLPTKACVWSPNRPGLGKEWEHRAQKTNNGTGPLYRSTSHQLPMPTTWEEPASEQMIYTYNALIIGYTVSPITRGQ